MSESIVRFKRLENQGKNLNWKKNIGEEMKMFQKYQLAVWLSIRNFYSHFTKGTRKCECFCSHCRPLLMLQVIRSLSMKNDDHFFFDINRRTEIHRASPSKTWGVRAGFWVIKMNLLVSENYLSHFPTLIWQLSFRSETVFIDIGKKLGSWEIKSFKEIGFLQNILQSPAGRAAK